jgi:DUF4097 and DUF4098 domain-containing protein YvlB
MPRNLRIIALSISLLALLPATPAHAFGVNKSIDIEAGSESGGASTVNGSITVGAGATVTGGLETVNGAIRIDENAVIEDAETVNGSIKIAPGVKAQDIEGVNGTIRVGANVTINGEISVVNGQIGVDKGSSVGGDVNNVNGEIRMTGAEIGGDLSTVNGDVTLDDGANLHGNLTIEKSGGWHSNNSRKPKIIIGPGCKVGGQIIAEREVELYISDSAEVGGVSGVMSMDQAVRFSGNRP